MKLKVRILKISAGKPVAFIHERTSNKIGVHTGDRVILKKNHHNAVAIIDVAYGFLSKNEIAVSQELAEILGSDSKGQIEVVPSGVAESSAIINDKINCKDYSAKDLEKIMQDIVNNRLSEAEIAYFISGVNHCGMKDDEIINMTRAIVKTGKTLNWGKKIIADKHCIGGIPGNRTTPIVVSICAVAGVTMPKTSSRAITSAAGTADAIEVLAPVSLSLSEMKRIVSKTGACLAWGGSLGLAPADDKLIRVEKLLRIDPEPQLLASILAKKVSVGSTHVLIDIPYGETAKVSHSRANHLKKMFESLGHRLGLKVKALITDGRQPVGNGIGPVLEMKDVIRVLKQDNPPIDLEKKSVLLAGAILEMVGKAKKGQGMIKALDILYNGSAYQKFCEIIRKQGGDPKSWLPEAKFNHTIFSSKSSTISRIDNQQMNYIARMAGCPNDKSAGIYLYKHAGEKIKSGEKIATIYSESKEKLNDSLKYFRKQKPVVLA